MPKAAIQATVRLDPELYDQAQKAAKKAGVALNTWIAEAMRERLERRDQ